MTRILTYDEAVRDKVSSASLRACSRWHLEQSRIARGEVADRHKKMALQLMSLADRLKKDGL